MLVSHTPVASVLGKVVDDGDANETFFGVTVGDGNATVGVDKVGTTCVGFSASKVSISINSFNFDFEDDLAELFEALLAVELPFGIDMVARMPWDCTPLPAAL